MGELVLAAKVTHVPTMLLSEQPGPLQGCRQAAIDGHREIGRRARAAGADTVIVLDTHWLVNAAYHIP
jgi:3,4-dihydroxyphenylacetate 2,3-dioxygenase